MSLIDDPKLRAPGFLKSIYAAALLPYSGEMSALALMHEAEQVTGLSDWGGLRWGEPGFRKRFNAICTSVETEAHLTPLGITRVHSRFHAMLCSRLLFIAYRNSWQQEPVIAPPFVGTGFPRAGTSFLQELMAQDPDCLVPFTAHGTVPVPPPGVIADEAERMELVRKMLDFQGFDAPEIRAIHPIDPDTPNEDVMYQEAACGSLYQAFFNCPGFMAVVQESWRDFFEWQKGVMQLVQGVGSAKRWVLKAPEYLSNFETMQTVFPGAMVFVNHRDPGKVVASLASLFVHFQALNSAGAIDPKYLGPPILEGLMAGIDKMTQYRAENPNLIVVDVQYKTLIADPIGQAERVYAAFGLELNSTTKHRMEQFLKVNRHGQSQHGVIHRYDLEEFGLTEASVEKACGGYLDRYGVTRETRN